MTEAEILYNYLKHSLKLVILNANNYCNMRCSYCYETHAPSIKAPSRNVLNSTSQLLTSCKNKTPLLIHGGEPLLNDIDWFNLLSETLVAENSQPTIFLQTNASLLDDIKLRWIIDNRVRIGISCDGPPYINNLTRGNSDLIETAFEKLRNVNIPFGIISVISKSNFKHIEEILDYFEKQGASSIRLNRIFTTRGGVDISDEEYNITLSRAWNWAYCDNRRLRIYDICELEKSLLGATKRSSICNAKPCGAGDKVLSIDADGNLYPCNRMVSNREFSLGTLFSFDKNAFEKFFEYKHRWFQRGIGACLAMSVANSNRTCFQRPNASHIASPFSEGAMNYALRYSSSNSAHSNWEDWSWDDYSDRA